MYFIICAREAKADIEMDVGQEEEEAEEADPRPFSRNSPIRYHIKNSQAKFNNNALRLLIRTGVKLWLVKIKHLGNKFHIDKKITEKVTQISTF